MEPITVRMDICFTAEGDAIPLRTEEEIADIEQKAKAEKDETKRQMLEGLVLLARAARKNAKGTIRTESVTFPRPTGADKVAIRNRAREEGPDGLKYYNPELEPLAALEHMLSKPEASWTLLDETGASLPMSAQNIREKMPMCLQDACYEAIRSRLYSLQARLDFLAV